jgi:hypothetical protein
MNPAHALGEAVSALYFADDSDYKGALQTIVRDLGGQAALDLLDSNPSAAYHRFAADRNAEQPRPTALDEADLCEIFGKRPDGTRELLGKGVMPPAMKARELLRDYGFDDPDNEDSESGYAMAAIEDLLKWMLKVGWQAPPLVTITASKEGD